MAGSPKKRREREIEAEMARTPGVSRKAVVLRLAKRRERARTAETRTEQRAAECLKCRDEALLMSRVRETPRGCWSWRGTMVATLSGRVRPMIRVGQYGRAFADLVMYELKLGKRLPKGCFLFPACGNLRCIRPDHQAVTNKPVEHAKKRARKQGGDDDQQQEQGMVERERKVG
jgi:hypothetical protein